MVSEGFSITRVIGNIFQIDLAIDTSRSTSPVTSKLQYLGVLECPTLGDSILKFLNGLGLGASIFSHRLDFLYPIIHRQVGFFVRVLSQFIRSKKHVMWLLSRLSMFSRQARDFSVKITSNIWEPRTPKRRPRDNYIDPCNEGFLSFRRPFKSLRTWSDLEY